MVFLTLLDPILWPLLKLQPLWAILVLSLLITVIINIITKLVTDQNLMKDLKEEMKALQKQMKTLKDDPKKMMSVNKRFTEVNMKYMGKSMKSTLFTFIPIIIIFGWMNAHLAYEPINPGQEFAVTLEFADAYTGTVTVESLPELQYVSKNSKEVAEGNAIFTFKASDPGEYRLKFSYGEFSFEQDVLISSESNYVNPIVRQKDKYNPLKRLVIGNEPIKPFGDFSLFGWKPGWLATYIVFSIFFSMGLRKLMKVY